MLFLAALEEQVSDASRLLLLFSLFFALPSFCANFLQRLSQNRRLSLLATFQFREKPPSLETCYILPLAS